MRSSAVSWLLAASLVLLPAAGAPHADEVSRAQKVRVRAFKLLNDGIEAYRKGRVKEAIPLLQEVSDIALNSFRAYYYLGLALKADRQYVKAIDPLEVALELDPLNLQARVALGDCYLKRGDPVEALAEYHRALARQADYAPAMDGLGRAAEAAGDDLKAADHYRKAIELNPGFPDAALNLGDLYMRQGRYAEAIELFLQAIKVRPDFAAAYNRLGVCYSKQRLGNEAIAALRRAETLEEGNPWHPVEIGGIFVTLDNLVQAQREFDKALELDPDYLEGYLAKASLLRREGAYAEALDLLGAGLNRDVDDPATQAKLREMKALLQKEQELEAGIEARLSPEGRGREDLLALAELKAGREDHAGAAALYAEAAALGAPDPAILQRLGYSALRAGLYREAADACATLSGMEPDQPGVWINLGLARTWLGDEAGAESALREASRLRPGDPLPLAYLGNLYVLAGRGTQAIEALNASLALMTEESQERPRVRRLLQALLDAGKGSS